LDVFDYLNEISISRYKNDILYIWFWECNHVHCKLDIFLFLYKMKSYLFFLSTPNFKISQFF
jgi:hypothetical protein